MSADQVLPVAVAGPSHEDLVQVIGRLIDADEASEAPPSGPEAAALGATRAIVQSPVPASSGASSPKTAFEEAFLFNNKGQEEFGLGWGYSKRYWTIIFSLG